MADWGLQELLLRLVDFDLRGLQWQNGSGKGQRPKPLELPDSKSREQRAAKSGTSGDELPNRLRALGM
jgi:hypothetical protein